MISVLLVDDDKAKSDKVASLCRTVLDGYDAEIEIAVNVSDAVQKLRRRQYDLLILDLSLPMRVGGSAVSDGGVRILRQIVDGRPGIRVPKHIVGLSAYEELVAKEAAIFAAQMWSLVKYDGSSDAWEHLLAAKLLHLTIVEHTENGYQTDLAIVTALHAVELEAVLALPAGWCQETRLGDDTIYYRGEFEAVRPLRVVCAASTEMGLSASSALTSKMIAEFRPRYLCMVGIAAGTRTTFSFGDVLIATHAYDYGAGKAVRTARGRSAFQPAPDPIEVSRWIRARIEVLRLDPDLPRLIVSGWSGVVPPKPPSVRHAPIASGAAVIADRKIINSIVRRHRKVVGVEMEVYGVLLAAKVAKQPRPMAFAMKSVCDFGGRKKDDRYQEYAAHTSARCLYEFARRYLV